MSTTLSPVRAFVTDRGDDQHRIDHVLMRHLAHLTGLSRTKVQGLVADGCVDVDGKRAGRVAQRLRAGQRLAVRLPATLRSPAIVTASPMSLDIVYQDSDFLAVNKPAGLVVHPSYRNRDGTLLNALAHYAEDWPSGRPSLVHRLDKHTSGILLVAKSGEVHAALVRALGEPQARKEYLALCYGRLRAPRRRLRYPLARDPLDRRRVIVQETGIEAVTEVTREAESHGTVRGLTIVRCRLVTGRTHQIRVHLQADGVPIIGDPVYGIPGWQRIKDVAAASALRMFSRQALHAASLTFVHPRTRLPMCLEAPLPADMTALLRTLRLPEPPKPTRTQLSEPTSVRFLEAIPVVR